MLATTQFRLSWALALGSMALASPAHGVPDLASRRMANAVVVFADDQRSDLFYYAPRELKVVTAPDGKPDFSLVEMRYTGKALSRDRGLVLHRSLLTLRVQLPAHGANELANCGRVLGTGGRSAELRPLPIQRIEAALVYATLGALSDTLLRRVPGGQFQGRRDAEGPATEGYWNERVFTVGLDSLTAQVLHATLEGGMLSMSLGYACIAEGRIAPEPWGAVAGAPELAAALEQQLASVAAGDSARRDTLLRRVASASALPIRVDARQWPELLKRIDVDADSPSGFAALDVYCYDFRDNRRPDLYEKQVEVEAESVGGRRVRLQAWFARAHPDIYSASLVFPVAVKLDRPYRFRVSELRPDGSLTQGTWHAGRDWVGLLDLTTKAVPAARGVRSIR